MATIPVTTLTWGNAHSLVLQQREKRAVATLKIMKPNGKQKIPIALPSDLTVEEIVEAWRSQGEKWHELEVTPESPVSKRFAALRVIWLPKGRCIMWNVLHIDNKPYDTCGVTELTPETWGKTI